VCLALAATACLFPKQVLTVDSGEVKGDVLVVLGGGSMERVGRAVELFQAGAAPKIICTGLGDCESNKRELVAAGVPESAVGTECASHNTYQNAKYTAPLLRQLGARRVILVTTWYHSRRALASFRHCAPDLEFFSRPSYLGYDSPDRAVVRNYMRLEYPKLLGYWVVHGVGPF
jgi:uncharacterized SAM-binding protein YcdF (DUF218 family)